MAFKHELSSQRMPRPVPEAANTDHVDDVETPDTLLAERLQKAQEVKDARAAAKASQHRPLVPKSKLVQIQEKGERKATATSLNTGEQYVDDEVSHPPKETITRQIRKIAGTDRSSKEHVSPEELAELREKWDSDKRAKKEIFILTKKALPRAMHAEKRAYRRQVATLSGMADAPHSAPEYGKKGRERLKLDRSFDPTPVEALKTELHQITQEHALRESTPESRTEYRRKLAALLNKYAPEEPSRTASVPTIETDKTPTETQTSTSHDPFAELASKYQQSMDEALSEDSVSTLKAANRARLQKFIDNARRVNEEAVQVRTTSTQAPEQVPSAEAAQDRPIVMLNSILSKQAGLKGVKPPVFGAEPDPSPIVSGVQHSSSETATAEAEAKGKAKGSWMRWFGVGGGVGTVAAAFLALFAHGDQHEVRQVRGNAGVVRVDVEKAVMTSRAMAASAKPEAITIPASKVTAQEAYIERGEGANALYSKLMVKLKAAYTDPATRPPLVQKLFEYKNADAFSQEMKFEKLPNSYPMHRKDPWHAYADTVKLSEDGKTLVYVDANNEAHVLMETTPQGKVVVHPQEDLPMRNYGHRSYTVNTKKIEQSYTPAPRGGIELTPDNRA